MQRPKLPHALFKEDNHLLGHGTSIPFSLLLEPFMHLRRKTLYQESSNRTPPLVFSYNNTNRGEACQRKIGRSHPLISLITLIEEEKRRTWNVERGT